MTKDQDTSENRLSGVATMSRGDLRFTARAVTGDVVIGAIDESFYQLLTIYLSPEKARELLQQINEAAATAADYRIAVEIDDAFGGESE